MHHVMFDVDGTLVQSESVDEELYRKAVLDVTGEALNSDWAHFNHITDAGILAQHLAEAGIQESEQGYLSREVKGMFTRLIEDRLNICSLSQIQGAADFIAELRKDDGVTLSIATGGWRDTALIKLKSAQIDISGIHLASSDDHYARVEIMKIAKRNAAGNQSVGCTYFGDGKWDQKASHELGYNFVQIGNESFHHQSIVDFKDVEMAKMYIGI